MRILFVVPYMPNLIRVRPYNLIRALSARGHELTVLTTTTGPSEEAEGEALEQYCDEVISRPLPRWRSWWNSLAALPSTAPLQSAYCWQPALAEKLPTLLDEEVFDVVHVEHLRGARYGIYLTQMQRAGLPPIVWDSVDCISTLFRQAAEQSESFFGRWITRLELGRTERYERWLIQQFNRVLVTSPADREALLSLLPDGQHAAPINVLANGVDLEYFQPAPEIEREPATLVLSGKMSYHANVTMALHLAREIMPTVWDRRPDATLTIVGKDPPREILALAQNPAITVTGTVADVRPYLQRATIAVAPITYGAGIQNKVLEAMACGAPVLTTPRATTALNAVAGRDLHIAEGAGAFAEAVLHLLEDTEERARVAGAGRTYVQTQHDWGAIAARLEDFHLQAIEEHTS